MALMSLTHLVNAESDPYIILANETVKARYAALMNALGLPADESAQNTMYGPGFDAPEGTVRISLANLNEEDYVEIARRLFELLDDYYSEYKTSAMDEAA
jgi:aspartate 4-decarboxylase